MSLLNSAFVQRCMLTCPWHCLYTSLQYTADSCVPFSCQCINVIIASHVYVIYGVTTNCPIVHVNVCLSLA